jgi:hypothetical protein
MIVAGGLPSITAALAGSALSVLGARPNGHISTAPLTTGRDISWGLYRYVQATDFSGAVAASA